MKPEDKIFGLENFGNTCYCNSVLQALYHTKPFRDYIYSLSPTNRAPRLHADGKTPHHTKTAAVQRQASAAQQQQQQQQQQSQQHFTSLRSKFSRSSGNPSSSAPSSSHSAASPASAGAGTESMHSSTSSLVSTKNKPQLGNFLTSTTPMVGFLEDPIDGNPINLAQLAESGFSGGSGNSNNNNSELDGDGLIEVRKRKALMRGPIINADQGFHESYNREESLVTALKDLFESIGENESARGVASPSRLVEILKQENDMFRSSMHQDAQEFLNFLLNRLVEEEALYTSKLPGPSARDIFSGELTNEMRCLFCETVTRRNEAVYDVSVDTVPNTSLFNCLKKFSSYEVLGGANKFFCDVCGSHQEALKRMKVRKVPKMLILHLKRFKFSEAEQRNTKLLHRVLYSRYLRIPVTTDDCKTPEKLYELSSVIVHLGDGPYIGHYVVVTKTPNGWLLFDDEIVDQVDESFVYKFFGGKDASMATAYLMIYQEISEEDHERANSVESPVGGNENAYSAFLGNKKPQEKPFFRRN